MNFTASCLDQLDCPGVRDALGGFAVDLHDLIANLRRTHSLSSTAELFQYLYLSRKNERLQFNLQRERQVE